MRATYKVSLTSVATFLGAAAAAPAAALALDLALFFPPFLGILLELDGDQLEVCSDNARTRQRSRWLSSCHVWGWFVWCRVVKRTEEKEVRTGRKKAKSGEDFKGRGRDLLKSDEQR